MLIGIDARLYGLENAGIGRYITNLVDNILKLDDQNNYVLFVRPQYATIFSDNKNVKVVVLDIPHYSVAEQLINFSKYNLDLLHVPHFNAPLGYKGRLVLTIHDLIKHHSVGSDTTTKTPGLYFLKRLGYIALTKLISRRADQIIVPSQWVKNDLVKTLGVNPEKVEVIYEAVDRNFGKGISEPEIKQLMIDNHLKKPFLVYTGSVYPHKNVDVLLEAIKRRNQVKELDFSLAIVCARNVFWQRLSDKILSMNLEKEVKLLGFLTDEQVVALYGQAYALIQPSKMEGFGLTGLEAMKVGLPVIAAKATCLPEIYQDAAVFFDPNSVEDLIDKLNLIAQDRRLYQHLSTYGKKHVKKFSWKKAATATIRIYNQVCSE